MALTPLACGGGGKGEAFEDVLRGLRSAAESRATYDALRHSDDLEKSQKAVINAFCQVTTQLADNRETVTEEEYFARIRAAAAELGAAGSKLDSALSKLRATYDLAKFNPRAAQLYARACFG
jgi:hypothetical protein